MFRYTSARVRGLPPEEKKLGRPLYAVALSLLLLGCASFASFAFILSEQTTPVHLYQLAYWILLLLGTGILSAAALMILEWDEIIVFPMMFMFLGLGVAMTYDRIGMDAGVAALLIDINAAFLYLLPVLLFNYSAYRTRRSTSLSSDMVFSCWLLSRSSLFCRPRHRL
ncbi:MAG: hypothetical protein ACTSV8_03700 [Candidatus Thorarchaeota archaeon]